MRHRFFGQNRAQWCDVTWTATPRGHRRSCGHIRRTDRELHTARLPRHRLSGSRSPRQRRPFGPSLAIGYADLSPGDRSDGTWAPARKTGGC